MNSVEKWHKKNVSWFNKCASVLSQKKRVWLDKDGKSKGHIRK